jgi:hypothetical protein
VSLGKRLIRARTLGPWLSSCFEGEGQCRPDAEAIMLYLRIIGLSAALAMAGCTQNDDEITRRVQERLASDGIADQVKVTTQRRVVTLEGVVGDTPELNRAEMAARNVPGILGVDNRLVVKNPVNVTGGQLEEQRAR